MEEKLTKEVKKTKPDILLVDDDRLILATLSQGLQKAGYRITQAASGEEALEVVARTPPDLAILDVRMPDMSGIELAKHLREKTTVPFMFFSAYSNPEIAQQAAQTGAVGFLVKPVDAAHIVPSIEAALARAAEIRTLRQTEADLNAALTAGRDTSIALGVIMERFHLSREAAFDILRNFSRTRRRKIHEVAGELLLAEETLNILQNELQN
jgi:response regulator NasT